MRWNNLCNLSAAYIITLILLQSVEKVNSLNDTSDGVVEKSKLKSADFSSLQNYENHSCQRVCQLGKQLNCYYQFVVHHYRTLGAECKRCLTDERACKMEQCVYGDGVQTSIVAVNRMVPGPIIQVCENDTIIVDIVNYITEPLTLHWHGLYMTNTPEMDGTPFVTQYPIQSSEAFRYKFTADRFGTAWYHNYVGTNRGLGIAGGLVIRQADRVNRHAHLYNFDLPEHTFMVQDIAYDNDYKRVRNILINGKGRNHLNNWADRDQRNRYERIFVLYGYRYRLRVIHNGIFNCPIEFSVENHRMLIISADGNDIQPVLADSFFMSSGERFDFVLDANQQARSYWVRVRGYEDCAADTLYQGAILSYNEGLARNEFPDNRINMAKLKSNADEYVIAGSYFPYPYSSNAYDNKGQQKIENNLRDSNVAIVGLHAIDPLPWSRNTRFFTYYTSFGIFSQSSGERASQIDDITYVPPNMSLLQARGLYNEDVYLCNRSSLAAQRRDCLRKKCQCTNVIRLPAYRPIEIVAVNHDEKAAHPLHLHGYSFRLIGQDVIGSLTELRKIEELDRRGRLQRSSDDYPLQKDTVQIPPLGYVIVRFLSNNPGYWMSHSHVDSYWNNGMAAVIKIGEDQQIKYLPPRLQC